MNILDIMDTEMAFACHRQLTPLTVPPHARYGMLLAAMLATTTNTKLWEIGLLYYYLDMMEGEVYVIMLLGLVVAT